MLDRGCIHCGVLVVAVVAIAGALATVSQASDLLLFNHSPSLPTGFYVRVQGEPRRNAIVTVRAADVAPVMAMDRDFVGARDRFIKRIAAVGGDEVCALGAELVINGSRRLPVLSLDRRGQRLDHWRGCRRLQRAEVLLLGDTEDSYDGRYWGPVAAEAIEGIWRRL